MEYSLVGRRATINLPDLYQEFVDAKNLHERICPKEKFVFNPLQIAPRPEWHGKKCTILSKNGSVIKIDGVDSLYELIPASRLIIEDEANG